MTLQLKGAPMSKIQKKSTGGVIVPIITPIDENENVDEQSLRAVIRHCIDAGVHGIFAGGSAGMGPLLTDSAWQKLMEISAHEVNGQVALLGGIVSTSTARALDRIKVLDSLGYGSMVVTPTYYITLHTHEEMMAHFTACRDATDMQMIAYNIPGCTGSSVPLETMEELARRQWIDLVKESSGDSDYFKAVLEMCLDYGIGAMQGNEIDIDWSLMTGAAGIVPVCANYDPALFVKTYKASQDRDEKTVAACQQQINAIREAIGAHRKNWISGVMYSVHTLGICVENPVRPLQQLSTEQKKQIDKLTANQGKVTGKQNEITK